MSPSARDDYLLRMIVEVTQALLRIAGMKRAGRLDEALQELRATTATLLGPLAELAPRLDSASAAQVVGHPDRILAWARLLEAEAEVWRLRGEASRAEEVEARALELALEARERQPPGPDAAAPLIESLARTVPEARLAAEHRAMLRAGRGAGPSGFPTS